jgi:hypothetical protein
MMVRYLVEYRRAHSLNVPPLIHTQRILPSDDKLNQHTDSQKLITTIRVFNTDSCAVFSLCYFVITVYFYNADSKLSV